MSPPSFNWIEMLHTLSVHKFEPNQLTTLTSYLAVLYQNMTTIPEMSIKDNHKKKKIVWFRVRMLMQFKPRELLESSNNDIIDNQ